MTKNDDEKILDEIRKRELLLSEEHKRIPRRKNTKKYRAEITVKGKKIRVGFFDTKEEAIEAIREAKRKYLDEI
ncbi:MAG: hypothetical protein KHZ78_07870 [Peptoniphilus sp. oral taxon 375]|nr:hypothetical protein [Peptoniphilus sp. oral taxon 375]